MAKERVFYLKENIFLCQCDGKGGLELAEYTYFPLQPLRPAKWQMKSFPWKTTKNAGYFFNCIFC